MDKGTKGAHSELIAAAWLLENGYAVFRNVSAHGPVDLVAIKDSEVTLIDVKSGFIRNGEKHFPPLSAAQRDLKVIAVVVFPNGSCEFEQTIRISRRGNVEHRQCLICSKIYVVKKQYQKFCTVKCRNRHHYPLKAV